MAKKIDHEFWVKYFRVYDVLNVVIPYQELIDIIIKTLDIKAGDLVLDAGCGTGNLTTKIKETGANVVGIDNCIEALERYRQKSPGAETITHDLTKALPFPDNYFDKIATNNVIYTLKKEQRLSVFNEFYRVLKPGGKLAVANACKGNKPIMIYFETVRKQKEKSGLFITVYMIMQMIVPTVKILKYNKLIDKENQTGSFDFVEENEQIELLSASGFEDISGNVPVYSNQAILNSGVKK